ncbi:MAG: beta-galactosidase, partial [Lentisphaeria bacterium]|nr:beta-galactosidase [Lentisphaeria bacterium]
MNQIIPCVSDWKFSRDGVDWQNVSLPHSVFVEPETIVKPQVGKAIYQYRFSAPEEWKRKIVSFEIGAAMQRAEVYVNGEYHFTHFGGYQKFFIPLTDDLKDENLIEIHLDNADSRDMPPGKTISTMDFCYHSGLYRDAKLHVWEPVHITDPLAVSIPAGGGVFLRTEQLDP